MADTKHDVLCPNNAWTDITNGNSGTVVVQNKTSSAIYVVKAAAQPTGDPYGYLVMPGESITVDVESKVWAYATTAGNVYSDMA